jgi:ribosomal protein L7/L12
MHEEIFASQITELQARMNRIERLMQQLLMSMTGSQAQIDQVPRIRGMLQELAGDQSTSNAGQPGIRLGPVQQQERPELAAVRQALLAGNKFKAIQLYRSLYGCGLKEAQDAIERL